MASSAIANTSKQVAIVLGVGPGVGLSVARLFAKNGHPVALLARTQSKLDSFAKEINEENGDENRARGYSVDATQPDSVQQAFARISSDFKQSGSYIHTGVFNPSAGFGMADFRSTTLEQFTTAWETQAKGAFLFAQEFLKAIESGPDWGKEGPTAAGTLLFTGATASLKAGGKFSAFSPAKFALRALSQSLAREYGPKGVHVAHVVFDGIIESENVTKMMGPSKTPYARLNSEDVAQVYWSVAQQKKGGWTQEVDVRPAEESW